MLGPPVNRCYDCENNLVAYHTCTVKYYTCKGATVVDKITLRCTHCDLLYNYSMFGNKEMLGFRHYPNQREAVEASDCVYFERGLLKLQCSLA